MYYHRFQEADTFLEKAFHTLHPFPHHQQRVLKYWIVCRLVHGSIPNFSFLEQYQMLDQFQTLLTHYIGGDIKNFQKQLDLQRDYFYVSGLYMILKSRTVLMLYRNFCKRILILFGNSRMQFSILQDLTRKYFDPDWTNQDVESMLVSLVDQRLIKGYLSHSQQIAVFAKSDPFPAAFIVS
ncbi:hypothetical protein EDD86DRAFT_191418 [Gorgonomyces haynaldii]|nr:hypothetical protein EDD86DRAFT_191418 [Gorgonomyces haynaldii]